MASLVSAVFRTSADFKRVLRSGQEAAAAFAAPSSLS